MKYVWEDIWKNDAYSNPAQRAKRAERRSQAIAELLEPSQPLGDLLELGCGDGSFAAELSRKPSWGVRSYLGIDRSPTAISRAKQQTAQDSRFRFVEGDLESLALHEVKADTVIALGVLEHLQSASEVVDRAKSVCRDNGNLIVSTSNTLSLMFLDRIVRQALGIWQYGYQRNYTPRELHSLLAPHFKITQMRTMHGDWMYPCSAAVDRTVGALSKNVGRYIIAIAKPTR